MCGILKARKEAKNMRILFVNLPYHGHVIPTIGLVQELIKAGAVKIIEAFFGNNAWNQQWNCLSYADLWISVENIQKNKGDQG